MEAAWSGEWQSACVFQIVMSDASAHLDVGSYGGGGGGGVNRDKRDAQYASGGGGGTAAAADHEEGKSLTP